MISPETPPASGAPGGAHAQSSRKRGTVAFATLLLSTVFFLAGAPAAEAAPAFTGAYMASSEDPPPPCRGDTPGVCAPTVQSNEQVPIGHSSTNTVLTS